jgi:hypothetical protein
MIRTAAWIAPGFRRTGPDRIAAMEALETARGALIQAIEAHVRALPPRIDA